MTSLGIKMALPPGTILQLMYLRERLSHLKPGRFIEIGPGGGEITNLLLELGWKGRSYELEPLAVKRLRIRFSHEISAGIYEPLNEDYFALSAREKKVDLIISSMVMEHFDERLETEFMCKSRNLLLDDGILIGLVPGSPAHWGIEDDIAGHHRRYTRNSLYKLAAKNDFTVRHLSGLTFPISNLLLPISNFLVKRSEGSKASLSDLEKTKASGIRSVRFKTQFPSLLSLILNRYILFPLHLLQKAMRQSERSLVLYFEASPSLAEKEIS